MFFYPDPEPIGHRITDVSPSYLTDGVFFNGRSIGPTHKCVAKQLSAIPRGPSDPVAPRAQVSPRTLERWTSNSKAWWVDNCGRNAKALYGMMGLLPKEKVDPYAGWKSKVALFPRSEQYEYWHIKKMRLKNNSKDQIEAENTRCVTKMETESSLPKPAFEYTETPIWWRDKIPKRIQCSVGFPDDYAFQSLDSPDSKNTQIRNKGSSSKNSRDNYVPPGSIYRQENEDENNGIQESQDGPDPVKVAIFGEGENPKDAANGNCDCSRYYNPHKSLTCNTSDDDLKKAEVDPGSKPDPRWHLWHEVCEVRRNDVERKNAMLNLSRPYHHEINTWYSKKKPTKFLPMLISEGKRPILQWHFSNL